jgi:hypothetical protein
MSKSDVLNDLWAMAMEAWPMGDFRCAEAKQAYYALERLYIRTLYKPALWDAQQYATQ